MAKNSTIPLILLICGILAVFASRALLAAQFAELHTFHLFDSLSVAGALVIFLAGYRVLRQGDYLAALALAVLVGAGMCFATLYSPYPFFGVVRSQAGQAVLRGLFTGIATLGGLVIMRQGGPVLLQLANGSQRQASRGLLVGLAVGLPLAVLNVFALQLTQGRAIQWQSPFAALLDALQPGIVEEVIYRFALWGLLWLLLRKSLPAQSIWLAGWLAMLVHTYSHFDDLFVQSPLLALGMGAGLALIWGVPPLLLARKRGLEAAIAFHWVQDVARFVAGF